MSQPYLKTWISHADQVQFLRQRGLVVSNIPKAEQLLLHLNYYRFSGYCLAFESQRHMFEPETTFEQVVGACQFDLTLRDLLTEALEIIEVDLRSAIALHFGKQYGAFGHTDASNFFNRFSHESWLKRLRKEAGRSSELFVKHFKQTYSEFPDLPVWMATEVMSFGGLSQMYKGMVRSDQTAIAKRYRLQSSVLQSWMHHAVYVRNLCAHHSRVWDRVWTIKPILPYGNDWAPPALQNNRHLFATLLLFRYLLKRIPVVAAFAAEWKLRVESHLVTPPTAVNPHGRMGLTKNWHLNSVWK